jgi:hypothetical protein
MANTYLTRTNGTPTSAYKCTYSGWVKRSKLGSRQRMMTVVNPSSSGAYYFIEFTANDKLGFNDYDGSSVTGIGGETNRLFRDTNAWYHIVVAYDTTQATGTNRVKVYVNGVEESSISGFNTGSQNRTLSASVSGKTQYIGAYQSGFYFDGSMSHINFVDGTAELPTAFGEYDANGVWKIIASPSVTYGTNGFFILKDGNSVTDQSPNTNNFTVGGGTLTNTEDSPSNVFATLNPLDNNYASSTFSNGNNKIVTNSGNYTYNTGTLGASSGKYYWEVKVDTTSTEDLIGISGKTSTSSTAYLGTSSDDFGYNDDGGIKNNGSSSSYGSTYTTNDIIGVAMDLDNNKLYFSKNGVFQNSGVPTSGATGTGAVNITTSSTGFYFPAIGDWTSGASGTFSANFGNGYFGTTAVASAGTNTSGIGIFEYDVPTGFTALSTKGLNL